MLENLFNLLNYSENERKVYLQLLDSGRCHAQIIAKKLKIPRTTVYSVLRSLIQKGLVSEEDKQGTTYFFPNKPDSILRLVKSEQEKLQEKERIAKELIEQIKPLYRTKEINVPKMRFYEGRSAIESMMFDSFDRWMKSARQYDSTLWGYQDVTFVSQYPNILKHHWSVKDKDDKIRLLSNIDHLEKKLKGKVSGREIKELSKQIEFSSSIWIWGDYIVLIMTKYEPHYAFQLHDRLFSENLRQMYKILWFSNLDVNFDRE